MHKNVVDWLKFMHRNVINEKNTNGYWNGRTIPDINNYEKKKQRDGCRLGT